MDLAKASGEFRPGRADASATAVELKVSAVGLANRDVLSKSDPFCVLRQKDLQSEGWKEVGRTETIKNNLNPEWVKAFRLDYFFEELQQLEIAVYDRDSKSEALRKQDFLGSVRTSLGEILTTPKFERALGGGKKVLGKLVVRSEEVAGSKDEVDLVIQARKLDRKDVCGSSDPFLAFYRSNEDGTFSVVHRTEVIKTNRNPKWKPFRLPLRDLCGGDHQRPVLVHCFDWNRNGKEALIGSASFTLRDITKPDFPGQIQLRRKGRRGGCCGGGKSGPGTLVFAKVDVVSVPSFLDFVKGGTQLAATIAVDFTASNGNPELPISLHYNGDHSRPNQYLQSLLAVGEIIRDYDSDKMFPVLGFGAKVPPDGKVSHCFNVNPDADGGMCEDIGGVVAAYKACLSRVELAGPTCFAPVVRAVAAQAQQSRRGSDYHILLIITDGVINDMPQTRDAIAAASTLPLSIIIVGVGAADFTAMEILDGDDDGPHGNKASRDIVQFVPFRQFVTEDGGPRSSQARLAKEVLEEIPRQLTSYMAANNIRPSPPPPSPNVAFALPQAPPTAAVAAGQDAVAVVEVTQRSSGRQASPWEGGCGAQDAIAAASTLPLSIIIVGVGAADFTAMEILDGDDDGPHGNKASRDIVQFVPFRQFVTEDGGPRSSQARLAKEVLEEIPRQLTSYMAANNIRPSPPPPSPNVAFALPQAPPTAAVAAGQDAVAVVEVTQRSSGRQASRRSRRSQSKGSQRDRSTGSLKDKSKGSQKSLRDASKGSRGRKASRRDGSADTSKSRSVSFAEPPKRRSHRSKSLSRSDPY